VTADGRIRHELLPDGRYDEARDGGAHAYQGSYRVSGSHIDYTGDTGFTADARGSAAYSRCRVGDRSYPPDRRSPFDKPNRLGRSRSRGGCPTSE